jgi:NADH-quinone oxidoreductase subunit L
VVAIAEPVGQGGAAALAWIVPVLPFLAFFVIVGVGKRTPGKGAPIGILAISASLVLSLAVLMHFVQGGAPTEHSLEWFRIGPLVFEVGEYVDGLTAVMLCLVTLVSLCVQVYSLGYMKGDVRFTWFYAVLSLFTAAMLNVIIANNLLQLLVGWEVMGVCSYLLIGHWWEEKTNSSAAIKAFLTTRVGDVPFLFGIFVLIVATGTSNIVEISHAAADGEVSKGLLTAAALLLFGGAIGKSAQFPLHVWLPDAMAGPTPVSALIHAATMVAAGVYLVGRMFEVFINADPAVLTFISAIAAITMLIAALMAMVQDDIKRVLAYSTVSQLAYMVGGLSLGEAGHTAGLFHLFTHGFFKALLFLGAGSVIHAVHSNNMSEMGGLRKYMRVTFWTFLIGTLALSGIPPLSGFWSKDEIITIAFRQHQYGLWAVALVTAVLTAFYMMRVILLTFFGEYRGHAHPHESPPVMTIPLLLLAGLSAVTGLLGAPQLGAPFADWVFVTTPEHAEPFSYGFAAVSIIGALLGIVVGYRLYSRWRESDPLRRLGPAYTLIDHKFYVDDFYLRFIVRPIQYPLARAANWFNQNVIDNIVNGTAWAVRRLSVGTNAFDEHVVDGAVDGLGTVAKETGGVLRYLQNGNIQRYAAFVFGGAVAVALLVQAFR